MWCASQRNRQSRISAGQPESIQLTRNFPIPLFIFHSKRTEHLLRPFTVSAKDFGCLHFIIVFVWFHHRGNFNWGSILSSRLGQTESAYTSRDSGKKAFRFVLHSSRMCKALPSKPVWPNVALLRKKVPAPTRGARSASAGKLPLCAHRGNPAKKTNYFLVYKGYSRGGGKTRFRLEERMLYTNGKYTEKLNKEIQSLT